MSFLQPMLLLGLPLALLPVIIHLINQHRHRTVRWAAMRFLLDARKMTKGMARLRQLLILAVRVLAVAALVFAASRPLSGGWLAFTSGGADTVVILLDRSASMEERNLETGESKRSAALAKLSDLLSKTARGAEVVLIDSATLATTRIAGVESLGDLPETAATETAASIPALLQAGLDYLAATESGRADLWLASDLRHGDWSPGSGQWQSLRAALSARESLRLFLLAFPETEADNLAVSVSGVKRRQGSDGLHLVMDLTILHQARDGAPEGDLAVPVEFTVNGTRTVQEMTVPGGELVRLGHTIPLGPGDERGWGRIDLPADDNPADNSAFFVFDEPPVRRTVIVAEDSSAAAALETAAAAAVEAGTAYEATALESAQTSLVPWEEAAQIFWQAPLPAPGSADAALLRQHVESGRTLVLLPPDGAGGGDFAGFSWGEWISGGDDPLEIAWWRTESGPLANTRGGAPLPVGDLEILRTRAFEGEVQSLLRLEGGEDAIARLTADFGPAAGPVYVWGTLPRSDHSNLATEGVAFFVMVHRGLEEGVGAVSPARFRDTGPGALPDGPEVDTLSTTAGEDDLAAPGLRAGAFEIDASGESPRLLALNRPAGENDWRTLDSEAVATLLQGVDYRMITEQVGSGASLAAEIWRAFLVAVALALLAEAALCMPPAPSREAARSPLSSKTPDPVAVRAQ